MTIKFRTAVERARVAPENRSPYDRDDFEHWISQGNNCDTRDLVLIAESQRRNTEPDRDCDYAGRWFSAYDGERTADASTFDIDHMVPLAEAWRSGAANWNAGTRQRFANDLADPRSLIAVTASSNRTKGDSDPRGWMPDRAQCGYLRMFVAVKIRWRLAMDPAEQRYVEGYADGMRCANKTLRVTLATVRTN